MSVSQGLRRSIRIAPRARRVGGETKENASLDVAPSMMVRLRADGHRAHLSLARSLSAVPRGIRALPTRTQTCPRCAARVSRRGGSGQGARRAVTSAANPGTVRALILAGKPDRVLALIGAVTLPHAPVQSGAATLPRLMAWNAGQGRAAPIPIGATTLPRAQAQGGIQRQASAALRGSRANEERRKCRSIRSQNASVAFVILGCLASCSLPA
jgi:hypothetical protein